MVSENAKSVDKEVGVAQGCVRECVRGIEKRRSSIKENRKSAMRYSPRDDSDNSTSSGYPDEVENSETILSKTKAIPNDSNNDELNESSNEDTKSSTKAKSHASLALQTTLLTTKDDPKGSKIDPRGSDMIEISYKRSTALVNPITGVSIDEEYSSMEDMENRDLIQQIWKSYIAYWKCHIAPISITGLTVEECVGGISDSISKTKGNLKLLVDSTVQNESRMAAITGGLLLSLCARSLHIVFIRDTVCPFTIISTGLFTGSGVYPYRDQGRNWVQHSFVFYYHLACVLVGGLSFFENVKGNESFPVFLLSMLLFLPTIGFIWEKLRNIEGVMTLLTVFLTTDRIMESPFQCFAPLLLVLVGFLQSKIFLDSRKSCTKKEVEDWVVVDQVEAPAKETPIIADATHVVTDDLEKRRYTKHVLLRYCEFKEISRTRSAIKLVEREQPKKRTSQLHNTSVTSTSSKSKKKKKAVNSSSISETDGGRNALRQKAEGELFWKSIIEDVQSIKTKKPAETPLLNSDSSSRTAAKEGKKGDENKKSKSSEGMNKRGSHSETPTEIGKSATQKGSNFVPKLKLPIKNIDESEVGNPLHLPLGMGNAGPVEQDRFFRQGFNLAAKEFVPGPTMGFDEHQQQWMNGGIGMSGNPGIAANIPGVPSQGGMPHPMGMSAGGMPGVGPVQGPPGSMPGMGGGMPGGPQGAPSMNGPGMLGGMPNNGLPGGMPGPGGMLGGMPPGTQGGPGGMPGPGGIFPQGYVPGGMPPMWMQGTMQGQMGIPSMGHPMQQFMGSMSNPQQGMPGVSGGNAMPSGNMENGMLGCNSNWPGPNVPGNMPNSMQGPNNIQGPAIQGSNVPNNNMPGGNLPNVNMPTNSMAGGMPGNSQLGMPGSMPGHNQTPGNMPNMMSGNEASNVKAPVNPIFSHAENQAAASSSLLDQIKRMEEAVAPQQIDAEGKTKCSVVNNAPIGTMAQESSILAQLNARKVSGMSPLNRTPASASTGTPANNAGTRPAVSSTGTMFDAMGKPIDPATALNGNTMRPGTMTFQLTMPSAGPSGKSLEIPSKVFSPRSICDKVMGVSQSSTSSATPPAFGSLTTKSTFSSLSATSFQRTTTPAFGHVLGNASVKSSGNAVDGGIPMTTTHTSTERGSSSSQGQADSDNANVFNFSKVDQKQESITNERDNKNKEGVSAKAISDIEREGSVIQKETNVATVRDMMKRSSSSTGQDQSLLSSEATFPVDTTTTEACFAETILQSMTSSSSMNSVQTTVSQPETGTKKRSEKRLSNVVTPSVKTQFPSETGSPDHSNSSYIPHIYLESPPRSGTPDTVEDSPKEEAAEGQAVKIPESKTKSRASMKENVFETVEEGAGKVDERGKVEDKNSKSEEELLEQAEVVDDLMATQTVDELITSQVVGDAINENIKVNDENIKANDEEERGDVRENADASGLETPVESKSSCESKCSSEIENTTQENVAAETTVVSHQGVTLGEVESKHQSTEETTSTQEPVSTEENSSSENAGSAASAVEEESKEPAAALAEKEEAVDTSTQETAVSSSTTEDATTSSAQEASSTTDPTPSKTPQETASTMQTSAAEFIPRQFGVVPGAPDAFGQYHMMPNGMPFQGHMPHMPPPWTAGPQMYNPHLNSHMQPMRRPGWEGGFPPGHPAHGAPTGMHLGPQHPGQHPGGPQQHPGGMHPGGKPGMHHTGGPGGHPGQGHPGGPPPSKKTTWIDPHIKCWCYIDPHHQIQSAFSTVEMMNWLRSNWFDETVKVALLPEFNEGRPSVFRPLKFLYPNGKPFKSRPEFVRN